MLLPEGVLEVDTATDFRRSPEVGRVLQSVVPNRPIDRLCARSTPVREVPQVPGREAHQRPRRGDAY